MRKILIIISGIAVLNTFCEVEFKIDTVLIDKNSTIKQYFESKQKYVDVCGPKFTIPKLKKCKLNFKIITEKWDDKKGMAMRTFRDHLPGFRHLYNVTYKNRNKNTVLILGNIKIDSMGLVNENIILESNSSSKLFLEKLKTKILSLKFRKFKTSFLYRMEFMPLLENE